MVLTLLACAPHVPPARAPETLPVALVSVLETMDTAPVVAAPAEVVEELEGALALRNFAPAAAGDELLEVFSARRETSQRIAALPGSGLTLLVETQAAFYSELSGKYRWTVDVHLSLPPSGLEDTFTVPVFLQFHHEGPEEALRAASPVIVRRVGQLADRYLAAR